MRARSAMIPLLTLLAACREPEDKPAGRDDPAGETGADSGTDSPPGDTDTGETDTADPDTGEPPDDGTTPVRLNQLVTRLLRLEAVTADQTRTVTRARAGWLFLTATGALPAGAVARVGIDTDDPASAQLVVELDGAATERVLKVEAGDHVVNVWLEGGAALTELEVRAIPALRYDRFYPEAVTDPDLGDDDWTFLETYGLDHLTTVVADWHWNGEAWMSPWKARGGEWFTNSGNSYGTEAELEVFYDYVIGVAASVDIGLDLDEFGSEDPAQWAAWTAALAASSARYPGTPLGLYLGTPASLDTPDELLFAETMTGLGHELLFEWYIGEQASEADLDAELDELSVSFAADRAALPGLEDHAVLVLGGSSHSFVNYDFRPDVDFHVHLDRQLERVANDEAFQDLHGLGFWTSTYMDEETIRWMLALYRHYGIEGATAPLTTDDYALAHVQSPDFTSEAGWTLSSSGLIGIGEYEWMSEFESRWGAPDGVGDTYLYTTRGSGAASTATQVLTGLTPGRAYSLRYYTIWYEDLYDLRGADYDYATDHTVHAAIEGATVVEGSELVVSFESGWPSPGCTTNQHRLRFVADSDTATLTLSDWASDTASGGEVWETFLFNFVQVQPYRE